MYGVYDTMYGGVVSLWGFVREYLNKLIDLQSHRDHLNAIYYSVE